ncbi:hypothetical protein JHK85_034056 [Glycine max]|nr:hypothetical protein JHK85_034056 [Glycine max]
MDVIAGILGLQADIAQHKASMILCGVGLCTLAMGTIANKSSKDLSGLSDNHLLKVKHLRLWIFECREPSHQGFMLGLGAAVLLGLAHAIANLLGGCNCICSQQEILCGIGLSTLVMGSKANKSSEDLCGFSDNHLLEIDIATL